MTNEKMGYTPQEEHRINGMGVMHRYHAMNIVERLGIEACATRGPPRIQTRRLSSGMPQHFIHC